MQTVWNFLIDRVAVGNPWYLLLLVFVLPPLIFFSARSLSGLGGVRRALAIGLRAAVVTLIVLALAELQAVRKTDKLTTMFVVDVSESIPSDVRSRALRFVQEEVRKHRRKDDLAGVVVFGRNASVETPPSPADPSLLLGIESTINAQYTDLAGALKLALATFPEDSARRIVLISDGNENRGNSLEQAAAAAKLGVQVDVLPVEYFYDREVLVEKVSIPPDVKKGETVNINVVIRASEPTSGTLQVFQKDSDNRKTPSPGNENPVPIKLDRGINVFTLKQLITETNFYTFTAEFVPGKDSGDRRSINNSAEGFTYARGTAQVLLIEGTPGEHAELVKALREKQIAVKVLVAPDVDGSGGVGGDPLPEEMGQLQPYDAVILGNVAKESLTEQQQKLLESNVHDMGAGLIMLGGPRSFGQGGWMNSPVEKALPVDMQIKAMKVQGKSALVMLMHASEIAEGNYWMKVIAMEALKTLSTYDYAGMTHYNGGESWLFTVKPIGVNRPGMLRAIDRMTPGDMPAFDPLLQLSMAGLRKVPDAMTRHIIVISDGDPAPPTRSTINQLLANKITVTTVIVAAHGNDPGAISVMKDLANRTKGRFYNVTNPKSLPRIYQKEARIISRPLIFEQNPPWLPIARFTTEPIVGIPNTLPPISGFVQTQPKDSDLVEIPIVSPIPKSGDINPILAHWNYGLGRSVAWTSDAGRRWSSSWVNWESYAAFWSQVVRWAMRPVDNKNLALTVRREEGRIKIVVDALGKDNQFLNFLQMQASVLGPDLKPVRVGLKQTAPGRYEGEVENAEAAGNYFVNLGYSGPDNQKGIVTSGISVPYSDEYRELRSNPAALETIASLTDGQVFSWKTRGEGEIDMARTVAEIDSFRRDAKTIPPPAFSPLWPTLLWLASMLFLGDVAVRRIAPDFARMGRSLADAYKRLRGEEVAERVDYMEKLKGRKAEVAEQLDRSKQSATRFEPPPLREGTVVDEPLLGGSGPRPRPTPTSTPAPGPKPTASNQADSYTNRLLKAKQKVSDELNKKKDGQGSS